MAEKRGSIVEQYDSLVNNTLKLFDTTTERDYLLKLKTISQLNIKINESDTDKINIKKALEAAQDECTKLSYKLKTSARLLDEVYAEKENLEVEKQTLKSQLTQLYSAFKKPDSVETPENPTRLSNINRTDYSQLDEKKHLNSTSALLSDISYSQSEDSSFENILERSKLNYAQIKKNSKSHNPNNYDTKTCEIKNMKINGGQIVATTTLTMDMGCVNAKSVLKTLPKQNSESSLASSLCGSVESISTSGSEKGLKTTNLHSNVEKKHNFVQKIIVIPETCDQCHKRIKFNNDMVKCLECKTIAHLECKDLIPTKCLLNQDKLNALNCGVPPLIVHCINEIEKRGLETVGLYRISGSDKEVKNLREQFRKTIPNLSCVDIHVLCSCLKDFIRGQNDRLISENNFFKLANALKKNNDVSNSLYEVVLELPPVNRTILAFLILHLQKVASSPKCCMDIKSLAIVFGPTIISFSSSSVSDVQEAKFVKVLIELLKLSKSFWFDLLKTDKTSSDELFYSTPTKIEPRSPGSGRRFFPSGLKRRILDSPRKNKIAKQVEFEKNIEFTK